METQYSLGLLVIAKNEGMVIDEFVRHYMWQGVDQIYLIDNGSTDDMKEKISPYVEKGIVQYFYKPESHQQEEHYNTIYNSTARKQCKWVIVCDVDEYIYNRNKGKNIQSFTSKLDYDKTSMVMMNWKLFGSSDFKEQPAEIRKSFLHRKKDLDMNTKCIVNTSLVNKLRIHIHETEFPDKIILVNPKDLSLNHYAIMSKEYFEKVKMTRGDASTAGFENVRDWNYFAKYDFKEARDDELATLI